MQYPNSDALIDTDELASQIGQPGLAIVDATWHFPDSHRDARAEFQKVHIPGAVFFDIEAVSDLTTPLPHMLPEAEIFASYVGVLGIQNSDRVVVYDTYGLMSAARAWWMFRVFGHQNLAILNGGLPKWQKEGHLVASGTPYPVAAQYEAKLHPEYLRTWVQLRDNLSTRQEQVLDSRSAARFSGIEPEPRPGLKTGHIPDSKNVPWNFLLHPIDQSLLDANNLKRLYKNAGLDLSKPVVCSCGSGITACVNAFALHLLGHKQVSVYDGSWAEWGSRDDLPIEK